MMALDDVLRACAAVALVGTVACDSLVWLETRRLWRQLTSPERRWLVGLLVAAALILALVPGRMVQMFTGYGLLEDIALGRDVPRYGAGQGVVLAPLFMVFGASEAVVFAVNAVAGWLCIVLAATLFATWTGRSRALLWVVAAVLVVPLLTRHYRSEAAAALAMPALLLALLHTLRAVRPGGLRRDVVAAWLSVAFAAHVRPEFALAGPLLLLAAAWFGRGEDNATGRALPTPTTWLAALPGVLLMAPQWLHLAGGLSTRHASGDLPMTETAAWLKLPVMLISHNLAFWPHVFPIALTLLALWAIKRSWRVPGPVAGLARWTPLAVLALMAPAMVDPPDISLPRLQAPALLLLVTAGAALVESAWPRPERRAVMMATACVALCAAATAPWHTRQDNSDHEAAFLEASAMKLAGARGVLHLLLPGDQGHDKVSRHQPSYAFRRPHAALQMERLADLPPEGEVGARRLPSGESRYVLLGVRCYAHQREPGTAPPATWQQADCRRIRLRGDLEVLLADDVSNRGDVHFPWWSAESTLALRLYRLER